MLFRVIVLFIPLLLNGQNLLPPIYNYRLLEYKGASKNWDLSVNANGELFVANNSGLLHFNGEEWNLNKLPNNTIIRSVESIGDKIYTGSYEEFGYWKKNRLGELEYTSLKQLIKDHEFTSEEFWEILSANNNVLFRSFSSIYSYDGNSIKVLDPPQVISDFIEFNDKIIVAGGLSGLFELKSDELVPLQNQELLQGKTVTDMVVFKGKLLVGTKLSGCYLYDGQRLQAWNPLINEELKLHQLNKILLLEDDKIGFGTIKNGMYLFNTNTDSYQILNRESGLQNNTVLSMLLFNDHLWLGLDNGIARAKLNNSIMYYTDYSGTLGMVYDMVDYNGRLYLGSNTGVFYFENNTLKFVKGSQGHVWDLIEIEGDLLCGHNTGTYKIGENGFQLLTSQSGGYQIIKVPDQNATYIQGTYNGLVKFKKQPSGQWEIKKIRGVDFPVKHLSFETPNILWAAHPYKGFYRIHLADNYEEVVQTQRFDQDSAPSEYNVKVFNIKNQMVFSSEGKWYKYNPIGERIVPFEEFIDYANKELLFFDDRHFWFVDGEGRKSIIYTDLKGDNLMITDLSLRERLIPASQRVIKMNDSTSYITLSDGFAKVDDSKLQSQTNQYVLPIPDVTVLRDEKNTYSANGTVKIPFNNAESIIIEASCPEIIQSRYFYELEGPKEYSEYAENGFINFQNLPHGEYTFKISTAGMDNKISEPNIIHFEIAPPWYLSTISMIFYGICAILFVVAVRQYNRRKFMRKQKELQEQMEKEQQERFSQLEKEKLAKEVKLKQNELASTTLNIAKKNEMILELKNMLLMNKEKFSNSQRYRSFITKLNKSIQDTEDWKRFEVNFKELHEDFFERLLKEYPSLTPKDLKLCAYLKMNLSTKEIAPLMAITVRGVEIHRYRLRKKLDMDSSDNLSNFLITF
ncbi:MULTISPECIES: Two component regulator three Y domain-containing protein [Flavobacteriaceae]|uniref:Two component regulator three Y domain-containing protein n=1 Tax=Flavobacteriaceae TaxID=49546 RepID=UPI002349D57E|nr:Two component regulator three Y domain-containing protein [Muricauda sp. SP22]MDC6363805.1 Two component regulator three Y domain-containing protein [Muricauda sp. SP22]